MARRRLVQLILWTWALGSLHAQTNFRPPNELQDLDQYLPQVPEADHEATIEEPDLPDVAPEGGEANQIVPELKGLVFIQEPADLVPEGLEMEGVHVSGVEQLDSEQFRAYTQDLLGKPMNFGGLDALVKEVVLHMRANDRPVVDAIVPQQNVSTGTIQVLVLTGKRGEVTVENNRYFESELIQSYIRLEPGKPIEGKRLMEDLRWINQNPFRQVDLVYTEGEGVGETDLILRTTDRYPLRAYVGYENTGTYLTSFDRWIAGFNWGNVWGKDHLLNYQFTTSKDLDRLRAHSLSYFIPLPWRHKFWAFGSFSESNADLPDPLGLEGENLRLSGRYIIPMRSRQWRDVGEYKHELTLGLDYIRSTNDLFFTGDKLSATPTTIVQALMAYHGEMRDPWGFTEFTLSLVASPGGLSTHNKDDSFQQSRAGTEARYAYARFEFERLTELPMNFDWILKGKGQLASTNLLASEQLSFGGYSTVRGYETNEVNTDSGVLLTSEIHTPKVHVLRRLSERFEEDQLSFLAFVDYGWGFNHQLQEGEAEDLTLLSVGPGLRYVYGTHFHARLDWGFQLKDSGNSPTGANDRLEMSAVISY